MSDESEIEIAYGRELDLWARIYKTARGVETDVDLRERILGILRSASRTGIDSETPNSVRALPVDSGQPSANSEKEAIE